MCYLQGVFLQAQERATVPSMVYKGEKGRERDGKKEGRQLCKYRHLRLIYSVQIHSKPQNKQLQGPKPLPPYYNGYTSSNLPVDLHYVFQASSLKYHDTTLVLITLKTHLIFTLARSHYALQGTLKIYQVKLMQCCVIPHVAQFLSS